MLNKMNRPPPPPLASAHPPRLRSPEYMAPGLAAEGVVGTRVGHHHDSAVLRWVCMLTRSLYMFAFCFFFFVFLYFDGSTGR